MTDAAKQGALIGALIAEPILEIVITPRSSLGGTTWQKWASVLAILRRAGRGHTR